MRIVKPEWRIVALTEADPTRLMQHLEAMGRICYQSEDAITENSYTEFLKKIIKRGHEAVLEHSTVTAVVICDRGVSHEVVRHRVASYCQESTRYCNYSKGKFGEEITVVEPPFFEPGSSQYEVWARACDQAESAYFDLLIRGATPQEARSVLPNSLKTQLAITMNIREWRHFFRLRCGKGAHPQMIELACKGLVEFYDDFPCLFEDIYQEVFCNET